MKEQANAKGSVKRASIDAWEPHIHSFVALSPNDDNDALAHHGDLSGIAVGVKDIIDVQGLPTRNGSESCSDVDAAIEDAAVVTSLRNAGASIVGKTTTTEFAFTDPTNCRNPHDLNRTPGGSSSGSGAAVAAGLVDLALGTQTAGSLCRPAAYCGVVGFKPSYGLLPTTGVTALATSFDTVGVIARSVDIARRAVQAMSDIAPLDNEHTFAVASMLLPTDTPATAETQDAYNHASKKLQQNNFVFKDVEIETNINDIVSAHRIIMNSEAALEHKQLLATDRINLLRPNFRAGLEAGLKVSASQLDHARGLLSHASKAFWQQLAGVDVVLTLPVPEGAPLMDGTTGFQDWLTPWTVFGGPLLCLPWGLDSLGRPRSVMLAASPGAESKLLAAAELLESLAPAMPHPTLPVT